MTLLNTNEFQTFELEDEAECLKYYQNADIKFDYCLKHYE